MTRFRLTQGALKGRVVDGEIDHDFWTDAPAVLFTHNGQDFAVPMDWVKQEQESTREASHRREPQGE